MFEAVLFDWDGTLADTRRVILVSFKRALKTVEVEVADEFIERRIGTGAEKTFREILEASGKRFDDALIKNLVKEKVQTEIEQSADVKLFPGAIELLEALHGKIRLALASMNNRAIIDYLISQMNLNRFFEVVLTVEEVTKFKPDPEIFLKCASHLGANPKKCVVVEDSIFGVQAANAAGMGCVAVLTGAYTKAELEKANPGLVVNSLAEIDRLLPFILR
jgi:HAD superfamily hydrolase (TIGR01509 family)